MREVRDIVRRKHCFSARSFAFRFTNLGQVGRVVLAFAAFFLAATTAAHADVQIISADAIGGNGIAMLSNSGPNANDLDRWRVGQFNGWGGCILVGVDAQTNEEICGCLGRQLSAVGPEGVKLSLEHVEACAELFIHGAWDSNWSQQVADQAPITFKYDRNSHSITGCWAEQSGDGRITGVVKSGTLNMRERSFSFRYDDLRRGASGEAKLILSTAPQGLTLQGSWSQPGASGFWAMVRDPLRIPFLCSEATISASPR